MYIGDTSTTKFEIAVPRFIGAIYTAYAALC